MSAPRLVLAGPSTLGAGTLTVVLSAVVAGDEPVRGYRVRDLVAPVRLRRLPALDELADRLGRVAHALGAGDAVDVVGAGLGALVGVHLALTGGPVRQLVAVDAPAPSPVSDRGPAHDADRFVTPAGPGARLRPPGPPESVPVLPGAQLARLANPLLCVDSAAGDAVHAGDHLARAVPTARLVRVGAGVIADATARAELRAVVSRFLTGTAGTVPAFSRLGRRPSPAGPSPG